MPTTDAVKGGEPLPIEVADLVIRYEGTSGVPAVDGASFVVRAGEVVALVGPNGAGKTSTLQAIEGALTSANGSVRVFGLDPRAERRALADRWGVMPQSGGLPMGLTVGETASLFASLHGQPSGTAERVLATMGLADLRSQRWRRLSGGEQQRLSVAVALCGGNDLLMLDEPTAAVDAAGRDRILELISARAEAGAGVLLTTHRFDDVEAVAQRVVVMDRGQIVASGSVAELTAEQSVRFTATPGLDLSAIASSLGVQATAVSESGPGKYVARVDPSPQAVSNLTSWLASQGVIAEALTAGRVPLEQRFRDLTMPPVDEGDASEEAAGGERTARRRRRS